MYCKIVFLVVFEPWSDMLGKSRAHCSPRHTQPSPLHFSPLPEGRSPLWGSHVDMQQGGSRSRSQWDKVRSGRAERGRLLGAISLPPSSACPLPREKMAAAMAMFPISGHGHRVGAAPRKGVSGSSRFAHLWKEGLHQGGDPRAQGTGDSRGHHLRGASILKIHVHSFSPSPAVSSKQPCSAPLASLHSQFLHTLVFLMLLMFVSMAMLSAACPSCSVLIPAGFSRIAPSRSWGVSREEKSSACF